MNVWERPAMWFLVMTNKATDARYAIILRPYSADRVTFTSKMLTMWMLLLLIQRTRCTVTWNELRMHFSCKHRMVSGCLVDKHNTCASFKVLRFSYLKMYEKLLTFSWDLCITDRRTESEFWLQFLMCSCYFIERPF